MAKLKFFLPLAAFLVLSGFLLSGLFSDPRKIESALINRPVPAFSLPDLANPAQQRTLSDLTGRVTLLNVWGLWCPTCNAELAFLTELRQQGVDIVGLYYVQPVDRDFGDKFDINQLRLDVARKLADQGDPYQFNIVDEQRSLIFDLGVTGAPETFILDRTGTIRYHHIGDINPQNWPTLAGVVKQLEAADGNSKP